MPLDRRLRDGFQRSATTIDPEVDATLESIDRRAHRHIRLRQGALVSSLLLAVVAAVVVGPNLLDALRTATHRPAVTGPPAPGRLAGRYSADLPDRARVLGENDLAGLWTLTIGTNGSLTLEGPPTLAELTQGSSVISGDYSLDEGLLRTNVLNNGACPNSIGIYTVEQVGDTVAFRPVSDGDACALRRAILSSATWIRAG